jgi:hypothetical protein
MQPDELDIPLNTPEGQILLGARDVIAEEAFARSSEKNSCGFLSDLVSVG